MTQYDVGIHELQATAHTLVLLLFKEFTRGWFNPSIHKFTIIFRSVFIINTIFHTDLEISMLANGDIQALKVFQHCIGEPFELYIFLMAVTIQILMHEAHGKILYCQGLLMLADYNFNAV